MNRWTHRTLALALAGALTAGAAAQVGAAARAAAKEVAESIVRGAGKESAEAAARELAQFGGEAAAREALERVALAGGEASMRSAAALARANGVVALRAIRSIPADYLAPVLRALDDLSARAPDLVRPALGALSREGEGNALVALTTRLGPDALEAAARHPGVGTTLMGRLGPEGGAVARSVSTPQAISVARHAEDIAALPGPDRAGVLALLARAPARTCAFLDKNPRFFLIAGAGALLVANADRLLDGGSEIVIGPDGKPTLVARAGLIERAVLNPMMRWLLPVGAALLALWGLARIYPVWRASRAKRPIA